MRRMHPHDKTHPGAQQAMKSFHSDFVDQVEKAVQSNEWVIVGMRQNPVVKSARKFLDEKNIKYTYIEEGSYMGGWKRRLAIKLWSGWPTFPQVFHKGVLIGGFEDLKKYNF